MQNPPLPEPLAGVCGAASRPSHFTRAQPSPGRGPQGAPHQGWGLDGRALPATSRGWTSDSAMPQLRTDTSDAAVLAAAGTGKCWRLQAPAGLWGGISPPLLPGFMVWGKFPNLPVPQLSVTSAVKWGGEWTEFIWVA